MKHARPDYDRFQDPLGKIPADEPVMLFRAQDKHFQSVLSHYIDCLIEDGASPEMIAMVRSHMVLGALWPKKKSPDV